VGKSDSKRCGDCFGVCFFLIIMVAFRCADLVLVQWSCCELIDRYKFGFPSIGLSRYQVLEC
jgi:hypothetical protein